jgi:hypothetical protein
MGIDFAHRTFAWENGAGGQAAVHCVVVGFSGNSKPAARSLWVYPDPSGDPYRIDAPRINAYLLNAPDVLVRSRREPLTQGIPKMRSGNIPRDGGHLSNLSDMEASEIIRTDPIAAKYLRSLYGAAELLSGRPRFCLWLVGAEPGDIRTSGVLRQRVLATQSERTGKAGAKGAAASTPALFADIHQPNGRYLVVPSVSSERRSVIPMAFLTPDSITNNAVFSIETTDACVFSVLQSKVFTAWVASVSSRLESRYQISATTVYNNFPWPELNEVSRAAINSAAQAVLEAREAHPGSSLADLYDPLAMPADLRAAHKALDRVVLQAYGLPASASDAEILELLFTRYAELVEAERKAG